MKLADIANKVREEVVVSIDGVDEEIRLSPPTVEQASVPLRALARAHSDDGGLAEIMLADIASVKACAVVDDAQPDYSDEQWANIIRAAGGLGASNPLTEAANKLVLDTVGASAKDDPVPFESPEPTE